MNTFWRTFRVATCRKADTPAFPLGKCVSVNARRGKCAVHLRTAQWNVQMKCVGATQKNECANVKLALESILSILYTAPLESSSCLEFKCLEWKTIYLSSISLSSKCLGWFHPPWISWFRDYIVKKLKLSVQCVFKKYAITIIVNIIRPRSIEN